MHLFTSTSCSIECVLGEVFVFTPRVPTDGLFLELGRYQVLPPFLFHQMLKTFELVDVEGLKTD